MKEKVKDYVSVGKVKLVLIFFLVMSFVACVQQEDEPAPVAKAGYLELNVGVGDFKESTIMGQTEQEAAVKSFSLFLFYPDGQELFQEDRHYEVVDGKIKANIPEEAMGKELSAYLVANEDIASDVPITEEELLQSKTNRATDNFITNGFPMTTERISVKMDAAQVTANAVLQRVPSALYVQVDEAFGSEGIHNNSYKIEVEGLQVSEGAMFQDVAASVPAQEKTNYSAKLTAVNTPENIAYFYQSENITVHIIPRNSYLGKEKVVTIDNSKSTGRNKRFLLKILPIKSAVTRTVDFTVQVAEWETEVVVAEIPTAADNGLLFAEGVSIEKGWYDENKSWGEGGFSQDSKLCWAATCTNMIQWWQDRYVADGNVLPSTAPNGFAPGREHEFFRQLAVFEEFAKNFPDQGGDFWNGVPWYFTKYMPELFPNDDPFMRYEQVGEMDLGTKKRTLKEFSDFVINGFKKRGVFYMSTASHARTVWGCKYNPITGLVEQLYITDSDDDKNDHKIRLWDPVDITVSESGQIMFGAVEIVTLYVLYAYSN